MTQSSQEFQSVAPLQNVELFSRLLIRLQNRQDGIPGMGCFYGPSGFGKTTATLWAMLEYEAVVVQMKSVWTKKFLCEKICEEMGVKPAKTIPEIVEQIGEALMESRRPLIIDEADFLMKGSNIEIARDIYESSEVPIILVGEEQLPNKLRKFERVHGRMLDFVPAQPVDNKDFVELCNIRCHGVEIAEDLADAMQQACNGSARRIVNNLDTARDLARTNRLERLTLADWGKTPFFTGQAPATRRFQ